MVIENLYQLVVLFALYELGKLVVGSLFRWLIHNETVKAAVLPRLKWVNHHWEWWFVGVATLIASVMLYNPKAAFAVAVVGLVVFLACLKMILLQTQVQAKQKEELPPLFGKTFYIFLCWGFLLAAFGGLVSYDPAQHAELSSGPYEKELLFTALGAVAFVLYMWTRQVRKTLA